MKIISISIGLFTVLSLGLFIPVAFAGGVEYPRSTDIILNANKIELVFSSGSSADSVSVDASSVTVTISGNDKFKIRSNDKYELFNDAGIAFVCKDNYSELIISGDRRVVVTPIKNRCVPPSDVVPAEPSSDDVALPDAGTTPADSDSAEDDNAVSPIPTPTNAKVQDVLSELTRVQTELESIEKNRIPICGYMRNLSLGSSGADVATLQKELIMGEFSHEAPTGYFGAKTRIAIAAWQKANGISPATGYFGAISRAKLQGEGVLNDSVSCITRDIKLGDSGEDVLILQRFLKSQGADIYPEGLVTGRFGELTKLAIQRFQVKWGITYAGGPGFGTLGPKTRVKIGSMNQ